MRRRFVRGMELLTHESGHARERPSLGFLSPPRCFLRPNPRDFSTTSLTKEYRQTTYASNSRMSSLSPRRPKLLQVSYLRGRTRESLQRSDTTSVNNLSVSLHPLRSILHALSFPTLLSRLLLFLPPLSCEITGRVIFPSSPTALPPAGHWDTSQSRSFHLLPHPQSYLTSCQIAEETEHTIGDPQQHPAIPELRCSTGPGDPLQHILHYAPPVSSPSSKIAR